MKKHQLMIHQGVHINTSSAHEFFPQENDGYQTKAMNKHHDQHQFMSHQGCHTDICSFDELFGQWSAFNQDQSYDQHQLMIHQGVHINTST